MVGLPLHLWTTEILRKLGDVCGGFVAVDEVTEMKKEVKWARLLIKLSGKVRPSAVNILEGPRAYELQIWWEIPPWVTGVFPVVSRFGGKNPKEDVKKGHARLSEWSFLAKVVMMQVRRRRAVEQKRRRDRACLGQRWSTTCHGL